MKIIDIAKITHETNRAYCQTLGDESQLSWEEAPEWQRSSAVNGVKAHLKCFMYKGKGLSPEQSHESWLAQKREEGWTYGPVKDIETKRHPCFVPYHELPAEQRLKDALFGSIVAACVSAAAVDDSEYVGL